MSHIDDLNENQLEGHKWSIEALLEQAKAEVARYEEELKAIATRLKDLASGVVDVAQDKVEEVAEEVVEAVKKAAPKKATAKKAAAKTEEVAEEPETDK
jgi:ClpP class serine protease